MTAVAPERRTTKDRQHRPPLREALRVPPVPADVVAAYRPESEQLAARIVERIGHEVTGFADSSDPNMRLGIAEAINRAVRLFVDALAGAPATGTEVFSFYRWLGVYEANAGHNLDAMRAAHHVATQESWADMRRVARTWGLSAQVAGALGDALLAYQNALFNQALTGFMETRATATRECEELRSRLLVALISGAPTGEVRAAAEGCSWTVPEQVTVAVTAATDDASRVACARADVLAGVRNGLLIVIAASGLTELVARDVAATGGPVVAVSWDVALTETHHAVRWATRGYELGTAGIIEADVENLVRCQDHQSRLCLHADPALRRLADENVLAPLLEQTPKRRAALAETLMAWLQTRESAPALAARLGVHDQTVRHRLRRLRDLFGSRLEDPSQTLVLLTALESTVARWRRAEG